MPNRIVRESILTSDRVESLDAASEVFYRRLMSKVDDYGRYDARPSILRTSLFPLRVDRVREADCTRWMAACQKAGLIALYSHAGKPYLEMANTGWQARSPSKYPEPPRDLANICEQVQTNAHLVVDVGVVVSDEEQDASPTATPPSRADAKGQRLPQGWRPAPDLLEWAKGKRPDLDLADELDRFRDYWNAQPGAKGRKTDWPATYRNWIRGANGKPAGKFQPQTPPHNPGGISPVLDPATAKAREREALADMNRQLKELGYAK